MYRWKRIYWESWFKYCYFITFPLTSESNFLCCHLLFLWSCNTTGCEIFQYFMRIVAVFRVVGNKDVCIIRKFVSSLSFILRLNFQPRWNGEFKRYLFLRSKIRYIFSSMQQISQKNQPPSKWKAFRAVLPNQMSHLLFSLK